MKVDASDVNRLLLSLEHIAEGLVDTARCGDDGFLQAMEDQLLEYHKAVREFRVLVIEVNRPVEKMPKRAYLDYDGSKSVHDGYTQSQNIMLFKSSIYNAVRRELKKDTTPDYSTMTGVDLRNFIECLIIDGEFVSKKAAREYEISMLHVIDDLVEDIEEQRRKAPQQELFK